VHGQQRALNFRREFQVVFERSPFFGVEVVDAEPLKGVRDKAIRFHGIMAGVAQAVTSGLEAGEGLVDFPEERRQLGVGPPRRKRRSDAIAAQFELFAHYKIKIEAHAGIF